MFDENENKNDNILQVGVVGYSSQEFDTAEAKDLLEDAFDDLEEEYLVSGEYEDIEVVSGLTNMGIPRIAYQIADERGYKTIGVAPEEAEEMELYNVDEIVWVGKKFGDESITFIDMIDVLVKVGGGEQAEKELQMAEEEDISVIEYEL